jgi:hypothetical protein
MKLRRAFWAVTGTLAVGVFAPASAGAAFDPVWELSLSTHQAGANPRLDALFAQDPGEEPIATLIVLVPRGFELPPDAAISDGEILGQGELTTAFAPFCSSAVQASFDATLYERDRTPDQVRQGMWARWVADLGPVDVEFAITRLATGGWRVVSDIPANRAVCPPVTLRSAVNPTSAGGTMIIRNPEKPGTYTMRSILVSIEGSEYRVRHPIKITE